MISPVALQLGSLTIYWYSLFILGGILGAYLLARPAAKRLGVSADLLQLSIFYGVIPGIIGARLYHVVDLWHFYAHHLGQIFLINQGGLGIFGGLAGGALGLLVFARQHHVSLLRLFDIWAPGTLFAQALGRFGNWTNHEAFGQPTNLPWKTFIPPDYRPARYAGESYFHPTFFYEAAWDFTMLGIIVALRPRLLERPGAVLGLYFLLYAPGRILAESFRFDTARTFGIPTAFLLAGLLIILGIFLQRRATPAKAVPVRQSTKARR